MTHSPQNFTSVARLIMTAMEPGPLSSGMASGTNEMSSRWRFACAPPSALVMLLLRVEHLERGARDEQAAGDLQGGQRDREELEDERPGQQRNDENDESVKDWP